MKTIVFGLSAVILSALTAGCGFSYSERSQAVVAAPGAEYYGDRYYPPSYYYPTTTAYVYTR
jgi:hypothetical protein